MNLPINRRVFNAIIAASFVRVHGRMSPLKVVVSKVLVSHPHFYVSRLLRYESLLT